MEVSKNSQNFYNIAHQILWSNSHPLNMQRSQWFKTIKSSGGKRLGRAWWNAAHSPTTSASLPYRARGRSPSAQISHICTLHFPRITALLLDLFGISEIQYLSLSFSLSLSLSHSLSLSLPPSFLPLPHLLWPARASLPQSGLPSCLVMYL